MTNSTTNMKEPLALLQHAKSQTRSIITIGAYQNRVRQLRVHLRKNGQSTTPMAMIEWLSEHKNTFRPAYFRTMKAAIGYHIEALKSSPTLIAKLTEFENEVLALQILHQETHRKPLPERSSSSKSKSINKKFYNKLEKTLLAQNHNSELSKTYWRHRIHWFICAGIVAGLRPSEWNTVQIFPINDVEKLQDIGLANPYLYMLHNPIPETIFFLLIKNGKNTNGRATGEYRVVPIVGKASADLVERHIALIDDWKKAHPRQSFQHYLQTCTNTLSNITNALRLVNHAFPHITLYSGRHQFCANLKASGLLHEEVALLMGHASKRTAIQHYGKKRYGQGGLAPIAEIPHELLNELYTQEPSSPSSEPDYSPSPF